MPNQPLGRRDDGFERFSWYSEHLNICVSYNPASEIADIQLVKPSTWNRRLRVNPLNSDQMARAYAQFPPSVSKPLAAFIKKISDDLVWHRDRATGSHR